MVNDVGGDVVAATNAGTNVEVESGGGVGRYKTWIGAGLGVLLYFLAVPPIGFGVFGWIAFAPWIPLIETSQLPGRRSYRVIWLAGAAFWLATLHWLCYPHPATSVGWVATAVYLAFYFPAMVVLSRMLVHRWRLPSPLAMAIAWTGLELLRAHLITGFLMVSLAHSQLSVFPAWGESLPTAWLPMLQIADLGGEYLVTFLLVLTGGVVGLWGMWFMQRRTRRITPEITADSRGNSDRRRVVLTAGVVCLVIAVWVYGVQQIESQRRFLEEHGVPLRVAAIQGSTPSEIKHSPDAPERILREYLKLTREAVEVPLEHRPQLVVWPETMFPEPLVMANSPKAWTEADFAASEYASAFGSLTEFRDRAVQRSQESMLIPGELARHAGVSMLLGVRVWETDSPLKSRNYNGAAMFDADGRLHGVYRKMHRVLFGEYIPFADMFPWLERLTPLPSSLDAGPRAELLMCPVADAHSVKVLPNICYESVLPHVVRRQFCEVSDRMEGVPQLAANLTNDGWFRGSCELDQHLCCAQLRAIETRTPWVVAANTGFSAAIDSTGKLLRRGPRGAAGIVCKTFTLPPPSTDLTLPTPYLRLGDWCPIACLTILAGAVVVAVATRGKNRSFSL